MAAPRHDWYLKQWLKTLGKSQADIARDLEMNKAKVSLTANGKQPYDRDDINAISEYLNLAPFELLMHPADAMSMRQLRATAEEIVTLAHDGEEAKVASLHDAAYQRGKKGRDSTRKTGTHD